MFIIAAIIFMQFMLLRGAYAGDVRSERNPHMITPYGDTCKGSYGVLRHHMTVHDAVEAMRLYFAKKGLRIEIVDHWNRFIMADIYDGDAVVDRVIMDRKTGRVRSTY